MDKWKSCMSDKHNLGHKEKRKQIRNMLNEIHRFDKLMIFFEGCELGD